MGNFLGIGNLWFHKELFFVYTIDFVVCITKLQNFRESSEPNISYLR